MSIMHIAKAAIFILVTPMLAFIALFAQGYGFVAQLFNPTISVPEFSKSFGDDVVTAKDVAVYMQDEIASFKEFDRFDLAVSEIFMDLEENGRGVVRVTVSERNAEKPIVVLAELDTEKREFYQFADYGREGKLNPDGVLDMDAWKIDSDQAFAIVKDRFPEISSSDVLRYYFSILPNGRGSVYLNTKEKTYCLDMNLYSGEIINCWVNE